MRKLVFWWFPLQHTVTHHSERLVSTVHSGIYFLESTGKRIITPSYSVMYVFFNDHGSLDNHDGKRKTRQLWKGLCADRDGSATVCSQCRLGTEHAAHATLSEHKNLQNSQSIYQTETRQPTSAPCFAQTCKPKHDTRTQQCSINSIFLCSFSFR